jgi:tetratricopeptide (TPR) repeat protein
MGWQALRRLPFLLWATFLDDASMYNQQMIRFVHLGIGLGTLLLVSSVGLAQSVSRSTSGGARAESGVKRAMSLAESGHCVEALPLLRRAIHEVADRDLKKRIGLVGINCAMTHNAPYDSLDFLAVLHREFPGDPDVLYAAAHAYSDLSLRASKDLVREAPFSYQVHELNAEALETQGKWQAAAAEYQKIIDMDPTLRGIHARLGRALLSAPEPSAEDVAKAKQAFKDELEIDPDNATAEYVLGDLASREGDLSAAVAHFTRATKIDAGFTEAYLGLGTALVARKQFADAIPPLEAYEKLAPDSPTGHYELALAYNGVGRKEDANREAALQRDTAKTLEDLKRRVAEGLEGQKPPE